MVKAEAARSHLNRAWAILCTHSVYTVKPHAHIFFMKPESESYSIRRFRAQLSKIIEKVATTGDAIVITSDGRPVAELHPFRGEADDPLAQLRGSIVRFDNPPAP